MNNTYIALLDGEPLKRFCSMFCSDAHYQIQKNVVILYYKNCILITHFVCFQSMCGILIVSNIVSLLSIAWLSLILAGVCELDWVVEKERTVLESQKCKFFIEVWCMVVFFTEILLC